MFILTTFIHVAFVVVTIFIFFFMFLVERKLYFLYWALSWTMWLVKFITDIFIIIYGFETIYLEMLALLSWLFATVFLVQGVFSFLSKQLLLPFKILINILVLWAILLPFLSQSSDFINYPFFILLGLMLFITGIMLLRYKKIKVAGKYIAGWAIILSSIHIADFPFLVKIQWFSPYGYIIAVVLYITMAIGILLFYYQKLSIELSESEERFRLLAENARDTIFRYQLKTKKMDFVSPSVKDITGYTVEEFYSDHSLYHQLIYSDDLISVQLFNKNPNNSMEPFSYRIKRKDNKIIWVEQKNSFIYTPDGNLEAIEGIVRDVTKRKKAEEELRLLEKSRTHFITNISHDLRTPITSIQGYSEAIMKGIISEQDQKKYLAIINNKVKELTSLIDNLYELSQLESRKVSLNLIKIPMDKLIGKLRDTFEFDLEKKGLTFVIENNIIDSGNLEISIDVDKIFRVFNNLIYNAVKHTLPGGTISVAFQMNKEANKLIVQIKDTGSGIKEADLPHIFDRYYRGNSALQGSGLGLAIAKEIIGAHGGKIWVISQTNKGATFYFDLSIHKQENEKEIIS